MKDFDYYFDLFQDLLDLYEFDLALDEENYWRVIDRQGGNLGGIEQEQFNTIADIVDRMDAYHNDYILRSLEECLPEIETFCYQDAYNSLMDLFHSGEDLSEFEFDIRVLEMILYGADVLSNKNKNNEEKKLWRKNNESVGS